MLGEKCNCFEKSIFNQGGLFLVDVATAQQKPRKGAFWRDIYEMNRHSVELSCHFGDKGSTNSSTEIYFRDPLNCRLNSTESKVLTQLLEVGRPQRLSFFHAFSCFFSAQLLKHQKKNYWQLWNKKIKTFFVFFFVVVVLKILPKIITLPN